MPSRLSSLEATRRFRDAARALLHEGKDEITIDLWRQLAATAEELGLDPHSREIALAEIAPFSTFQALRCRAAPSMESTPIVEKTPALPSPQQAPIAETSGDLESPTPSLSAPSGQETKPEPSPGLGNDGHWTSVPLIAFRYFDCGDGSVVDVQTGLQWMRFSLGQQWKNHACRGQPKGYTWENARAAIETLNHQGGYGGYCDWRMPTLEELQTLVYASSGLPKVWNDTGTSCEGRYTSPTIYQPAFPETSRQFYWSASSSGSVWGVHFAWGRSGPSSTGYPCPVRLVRNGPEALMPMVQALRPWSLGHSPSPSKGDRRLSLALPRTRDWASVPLLAERYFDQGDGTVTDVETALQWMRFALGQAWQDGVCHGVAKTYTWQAALQATKTLNQQGGYAYCTDWRVPTRAELHSLVYCANHTPRFWNDTWQGCEGCYQRPTLLQAAFPNTAARPFWSSTSERGGGLAWAIYFYSQTVFYSLMLNGCRACEVAGWAEIALDFDTFGNFLTTKLVGLTKN